MCKLPFFVGAVVEKAREYVSEVFPLYFFDEYDHVSAFYPPHNINMKDITDICFKRKVCRQRLRRNLL